MEKRYSNLKALLDAKKLRQIDVAEAIKMDRVTFNIKINRYEGRDFTLSEAFAISKFINEPIDDFF